MNNLANMNPKTKKQLLLLTGGIGIACLAGYYYWDRCRAGTAQVAHTQSSTSGQVAGGQQVVKGNQSQIVQTQNGGSVQVSQKTSQGQPQTSTQATIAVGENAVINAPAGSQVTVKQQGAQTTVDIQHTQSSK